MTAKHVVAVTSGKGGVGKSTVAVTLAVSLAARGVATGLLDADVYGPDVPLMLGLKRTKEVRSWSLASKDKPYGIDADPVERYGVKVMSTGFIMAEHQHLSWDAGMLPLLLDQLVHGIRWGELDVLLVDLPPGTADLQQLVVKQLAPTAALIVVTPSDAAHLDARRVLAMLKGQGVRVLGGIENMAATRCPHCGEEVDVLPKVAEARAMWADGVDCLGRLPMDAIVGGLGDAQRPFVLAHPDSPATAAADALTTRVLTALEAPP